MTENKISYLITDSKMTLEALALMPCALPLSDANYEPPPPDVVKFARQYLGLSQAQFGRFLGKPVTSKGCSIVRKWETSTEKNEYRVIDSNAWRRVLYALELADPKSDFLILNK